jgi:putative tricarboxylic transport membrane protein
MTSPARTPTTSISRGPIGVPLVLIVFVLAYLAVALLTLDRASRNVPLLAGGVTLALLALELFRTWSDRRPAPGDARAPEHQRAELTVLLSVAAGIAGIVLIGFLAALPLYLIGAIWLIGRRTLHAAVATALLTTLAIYLVFESVLSYRLFPGVLFS